MATATIGQLTLTTSAAAGDFVEIEVAASGVSRRITKANFIGATLTGAGSIATGGFTLTVPANGTAALLGTAQTFSALKTFSSGMLLPNNVYLQANDAGGTARSILGLGPTDELNIFNNSGNDGGPIVFSNGAVGAETGRISSVGRLTIGSLTFGQTALNHYQEGEWTPASSVVTMGASTKGYYTRIGRLVTCHVYLQFPASADTTDVLITGLPFAPATLNAVIQGWHGGPVLLGFDGTFQARDTGVNILNPSGTLQKYSNLSGLHVRGLFTYIV